MFVDWATTMVCACGGGLQYHGPANVPECPQQVFAYILLLLRHDYNSYIMLNGSAVKPFNNRLVDPANKMSHSV